MRVLEWPSRVDSRLKGVAQRRGETWAEVISRVVPIERRWPETTDRMRAIAIKRVGDLTRDATTGPPRDRGHHRCRAMVATPGPDTLVDATRWRVLDATRQGPDVRITYAPIRDAI